MIKLVISKLSEYLFTFGSLFIFVLIGFSIGVLVGKIVYKALKEIKLNTYLRKIGVQSNIENKLGQFISHIIYIVTIVLLLKKIGISSIVFYGILIGVILLIIITVLIDIKDFIPDMIAWYLLKKKKEIRVGKKINTKIINGIILKTNLYKIIVKTKQNDLLHVPNSYLIKILN